MAAQGSSQHLAAARQLLDELKPTVESGAGDAQTKATVAVAHPILVLAEQVAAARIALTTDAAPSAAVEPTAQPEPNRGVGVGAPQDGRACRTRRSSRPGSRSRIPPSTTTNTDVTTTIPSTTG